MSFPPQAPRPSPPSWTLPLPVALCWMQHSNRSLHASALRLWSFLRPATFAAWSLHRTAYLMEKVNASEAEIMKDVPNWEAGASPLKTRWAKPMELQGVLDDRLIWRK